MRAPGNGGSSLWHTGQDRIYRNRAHYVRSEPGTAGAKRRPEHPPGSRTAVKGRAPPNQDPGNRAALRAGDGPENTQNAPSRPRNADAARRRHRSRQRTWGKPRRGRGNPATHRNHTDGALKRSGLQMKYNRRNLTCQGPVEYRNILDFLGDRFKSSRTHCIGVLFPIP